MLLLFVVVVVVVVLVFFFFAFSSDTSNNTMNIHTKAHIHIHEYMCVHEHMCSGVPQKQKSRPPLLRFKYWFIICVVFTGANFRHWHDQQQPPLHWPSSTFILSTITKQRFLTFYIYIQDINAFAHAFQHTLPHTFRCKFTVGFFCSEWHVYHQKRLQGREKWE